MADSVPAEEKKKLPIAKLAVVAVVLLVGAVLVQWLFVISGHAAQYEALIYGAAGAAIGAVTKEDQVNLGRPVWR